MAKTKVTDLTALTTLGSDDLLMAVDDPGGTPASKKITFANVVASLAGLLTGAHSANVANVNIIGGNLVLHRITASALTGDVDVTLEYKTRVLLVLCIATAAGGAGDTITVKNSANAITDAIDLNVSDKVVKLVGTIDDAFYEIAAAGTLRVTGASAVNAEVYVFGIRVA